MIEVIKIEFSLQCYFMVHLEEVKGEGSFQRMGGHGVPTHTEELVVVLMGHTAHAAFAKYDP